ncbi:hypothetical protein GTA08_BOTSDO00268 [Neofusicoccum parvum]|nr:hypothetical protein GTA08_BOTSDO00268 [Neofusicoccum parvum]
MREEEEIAGSIRRDPTANYNAQTQYVESSGTESWSYWRTLSSSPEDDAREDDAHEDDAYGGDASETDTSEEDASEDSASEDDMPEHDTPGDTVKGDKSKEDTSRNDNATPLPPSVEAAYYRKCIALKRRLNEIEANNEAARLRKVRLDRAILKMRLERAFLLERLAERMAPNVDDSDRSTSPPPTVRHNSPALAKDAKSDIRRSQPQEKPTRGSGIPYGNTSVPTGLNGTPSSTPFSGSVLPHAGSAASGAPGLSLPQPQFGESRLEEREGQRSAENGTPSAAGDHGRPFAAAPAPGVPGSTGDRLSAGPEIRSDANGERRIVQQDTEMGEADAAPQDDQSQSGVGFTAVNR